MKLTLFVPMLFVAATANAGLPIQPAIGEKTDNPQQFVLKHAEFPNEGLEQFDCQKCSAMKDLLFVGATAECGNAGCNFYVFKTVGKSFEYITNVFLNHGGFQFLTTKHHGMNDLLTYQHMSADDGTLSREEFDGTNFKLVGAAKKIKSSDFDKVIKSEPVNQIDVPKQADK